MRSKRSRASVVGRSALVGATSSRTRLMAVSRRVGKGAERAVPTRNGRTVEYAWARFALPTLRNRASCRLEHGAEELPRALVLRRAEELFGRPLFRDLAGIEEANAVGEF